MATDYRSGDRTMKVSFRMSQHQNDELKSQAASQGYATLQQYLEALVFGRASAKRRPGPQPKNPQPELPMTG